MTKLWLAIKWLLWRLGWMGRGVRALAEEEDPTIRPVYHDNPLFSVETWRLGACEAKVGDNQWFTVFVRDAQDKPLADVEIHWDIEWGQGVVADRPRWIGTTNERGVCRFMHTCKPTRYELYANGALVLSNVSTDLNVDCYCNPYHDSKSGAMWGWRKLNKPGFYGYYVYLTSKE